MFAESWGDFAIYKFISRNMQFDEVCFLGKEIIESPGPVSNRTWGFPVEGGDMNFRHLRRHLLQVLCSVWSRLWAFSLSGVFKYA